MARNETTWTWWTLPPAISGCLAQKYRQRTGVRAGPVGFQNSATGPDLGFYAARS